MPLYCRMLSERRSGNSFPSLRLPEVSRITGGGLVGACAGAHVTCLAISDVEGDDIGVIGSGIGAPPGTGGPGYTMRIVASNRIGTEAGKHGTSLTFYGSSFIAGPTGQKVAEADRESETVLTATFDLDEIAGYRAGWGLFRDRRPEMYEPLLTMDGDL